MLIKKATETVVEAQQQQFQNVEPKEFMTPFNGAWLPSVDPLLIGPNNYKELINLRYKKDGTGLEGISGYRKFNATPISTYTKILTGLHTRSNRDDDSYLIVHAQDPATNQGVLYLSQNAIGGTGTLSTSLYTDSTVNSDPRLVKGPSGSIVYANQYDTKIWNTDEMNIGSVFTLDESSTATDNGYLIDSDTNGWSFPIDVTDALLNRQYATSDQYITFSTGGRPAILILSTRYLKGIKVYLPDGQVNTNAANTNNIEVDYWNGTAFVSVASLVDGTAKMTQTGTLSFTATTGAKLYHYQERYLYAYLVRMSATSGTSSCRIYNVMLNAGFQDIPNVWDGIYRQPIQVQKFTNSTGAYDDYTLHVSESSTVGTPVGLYLGAITSSDYFILMFEEQMSAVNFQMLGSLINSANSQFAASGGVQYWNGSAFANLTFVDRTLDVAGDTSLAQSGLISWNVPTAEVKTTLFNTTGYAYKFTFDATASGTDANDLVVDLITGIPASKKVEIYKFPATYKNKLMLCGYVEGNEGNRIDYSVDNAPDVFNGEDSSMDGFQSIYVGGIEAVNSAVQLYNRFGSSIYNLFVILKYNEVWVLTGDSPIDYKLFPVSFNTGNAAPRTLTTAEVGIEIGENVERNVAMWISHQGPVLFDGAVLHPLNGIEIFFDPSYEGSVNRTYLYKSSAWFDSTYQEWNVLLPTGESTTLNTWLVYNLRVKKWFKKYLGSNAPIFCGIQAIDNTGNKYIYGGSNDGTLYELEYGTSWAGNPIEYLVDTGDFFPSSSQWDITLLRRVKFICRKSYDATAIVSLMHLQDTDNGPSSGFGYKDITRDLTSSGGTGFYFYDLYGINTDSGDDGFVWSAGPSFADIDISSSAYRVIKETINTNFTAWTHSLRFYMVSSTAVKGFEPIMYGYQYTIVRKDV